MNVEAHTYPHNIITVIEDVLQDNGGKMSVPDLLLTQPLKDYHRANITTSARLMSFVSGSKVRRSYDTEIEQWVYEFKDSVELQQANEAIRGLKANVNLLLGNTQLLVQQIQDSMLKIS